MRNALIVLFYVIGGASCVHTRTFHQEDFDRPLRSSLTQKGNELNLEVFWDVKPGDTFRFIGSAVTIQYSDGTQVLVQPRIFSRQFRKHVEEKYPPKDGYHVVSSRKEWVYKIVRDERHWGVSTESAAGLYDATPKDEPLYAERLYSFAKTDEGFERRSVYLDCSFPKKTTDLTVLV